MTDMNQMGAPDGKPVIPSGLNILTILTFIGSALGLYFSLSGFINGKANVDKMEETINSPNYETMPSIVKKMVNTETLELTRKAYENRFPILLIGLLGIGLCVFGAVQMRKRKMQGYYLYLVGEIVPLLGSMVFLGVAALSGIFGIISICIVLLFVLLYTAQRKHLTA